MCHAHRFGQNLDPKFPRFQSALLHQPSSTNDSSTAKGQKLTKQCFLPPPLWFSAQSSQYQY